MTAPPEMPLTGYGPDAPSKLLDELEMAAVAYLEDPSTRKSRLMPARKAVESLVETLRHIVATTRWAYEQAESELASLKEEQLTAEEADYLLGQSIHFGKRIYEKLRALSTKGTEK